MSKHGQPNQSQLVQCRKCNTTFNLNAQYYFDNLCPGCKKEADPEAVLVPCTVCDERVEREQVQYAQMVSRGPTENVPVCSDECANDAETPPWAPGPEGA